MLYSDDIFHKDKIWLEDDSQKRYQVWDRLSFIPLNTRKIWIARYKYHEGGDQDFRDSEVGHGPISVGKN